jgi:hypothetical protein
MYLDAMEFLEEEHDGWTPYDALLELSDEQLARPVEAAHGWSGRDLMGHLLAWQGLALDAARELAVNETTEVFARSSADWDARGGDAVNHELAASWAARPLDDVRAAFASQPGELRGFLTVVPESRWIKDGAVVRSFLDQTIDHYREHLPDLEAVLAAAR